MIARRTEWASGYPLIADNRATAAPTRLSGVEAPEVRPTVTGPSLRQPVAGRDFGSCPERPMANLGRRHQALRIGDVEGRPGGGADSGQICRVAAVVAANDEHQVDRLLLEERDDGILAILRRAADGVERLKVIGEARPRRSGRPWPPSACPRSRATRTSASWSGWPARCAAGRGPARTPAMRRSRTGAGRRRDRRPHGCSRRPPWSGPGRRRRGSGRRTRRPATRSPAFPRATPCRG